MKTDGGESEHGTKAENPNTTDIDPEQYRLLTLRVDGTLSDGTSDPWEIQTLVPLGKLVAADVEVGGFVNASDFSFLNFAELGLSEDVMGRVLSIGSSPQIQQGEGRVVLSTIRHLGDAIYRLTVKDASGKSETLGVTAPHRFYSESRGWVQARDLVEGEVLRGDHGPVIVTALYRQARVEPVFNLSVEADHVYYVGGTATLTHNSYGAVQDILKKFGGAAASRADGSCTPIAREIRDYFASQGKSAKIIKVSPTLIGGRYPGMSRVNYYMPDGSEIPLGRYHDVTVVDNMVFDSVFPNGIEYDNCRSIIDAAGGPIIKEVS